MTLLSNIPKSAGVAKTDPSHQGMSSRCIAHEQKGRYLDEKVGNVLGQLTDRFSPIVEAQTGVKLDAVKGALESVDTEDCEAPDDADKALFAE